MSQIEVDGRVSRIRFRYEVETDAGHWEASEVHELGLFTTQEMLATFVAAGFSVTFDAEGLAGRGLWIARLAP